MSDSLTLPLPRPTATPGAAAGSGAWPTGAAATATADVLGPLVRIDGVSRRYGEVVALDGVSLQVERGQVFGIIGRSGAGKSTLIRTLNALETVDSGRVVVNGQDLAALDEPALRQVRRGIGMVFQHFNLLSAKTVAQNVALPLKLAGVPAAEREAAVQRLLGLVGLSDKAQAYPAQLSGGQKQRVGIARALVAGPQLLLSDEATSALDPETTLSILRLLKVLNRTLGVTIVLITHEMSVIREICDQVAVLDAGRVVEQGPVWQVFAQPQADITRRLLRTVRPPLPEGLQALLQPQPVAGGRTLLRVGTQSHEGHGEVLALLATEPAWAPQIVHAEVDRIAGHAVGSVTFSVADRGTVALTTLRDELARRGIDAEVLGHVDAS